MATAATATTAAMRPRLADDLAASDLAYGVKGDAGHHVDPESVDPDTGYFLQKLLGHEREGFLWQKLRQPRSYDYKKAENKTYNERYRMPQFPFDDKQREAVMTFVLGLVAEPPAPQFVHTPSPREQARLDGLVVAEQYNCGGCHALQMDRWDVRYTPGSMGEAAEVADYPFLSPHFTPDQVAKSLTTDRQGRRLASLVGMPILDPETGKPLFVDEDGVPVEEGDEEAVLHRPVMLWRTALVDGEPRQVGGQNRDRSRRCHPCRPPLSRPRRRSGPSALPGGDRRRNDQSQRQARRRMGLAAAAAGRRRQEGAVGLAAQVPAESSHHPAVGRAADAEVQLPVDGGGEARRLLRSRRWSRLSVRLRCPPRREFARRQGAVLSGDASTGAMKIVTNNNYCVKCHLVGYVRSAGQSEGVGARQLERVHERLRPDYVHNWIANPKRFLPYTGMPVNIPFNAPVSQDLYKGTSEQQVDALADLLHALRRLRQAKPAARCLSAGRPSSRQPAPGTSAAGPAIPGPDSRSAGRGPRGRPHRPPDPPSARCCVN